MINIDQIRLTDLLTPNLLQDKNVSAAAASLDAELAQITADTRRLPLMDNLPSLDEHWIDELLWEYHVEGVEFADTPTERRELILNSIAMHRIKGTRYALKRILELLSMRGLISEWWEHDGEPYTFRIEILEVANKGLNEEKLELLDRLITEYKNTRSHLTSIRVFLTSRGNMRFAANVSGGETITVYPWSVSEIESRGCIGLAQTMITSEVVTIYP